MLPVHLCPVPGPLYAALLGYKESSISEVRRRFSRQVGRRFAEFFVSHRVCLDAVTAGGIDLVLPVPSSTRPGPASLARIEGLAELCVAGSAGSAGSASWDPGVLCRSDGPIGHMRPNPRAFAVPSACRPAVSGARVLLLDDTYVSGSRAQSAAATLRRAGARSVLIVPLGRVIRPATFAAHAWFSAEQPTGNGHAPRCLVAQTGAGRR